MCLIAVTFILFFGCDDLLNNQVHNFQKLKNISLKAVNFFSNKHKSNLFKRICLFSSSYFGVTGIFTAMWVILSERPITYLYDYAINLCTHRLEICTQGH